MEDVYRAQVKTGCGVYGIMVRRPSKYIMYVCTYIILYECNLIYLLCLVRQDDFGRLLELIATPNFRDRR